MKSQTKFKTTTARAAAAAKSELNCNETRTYTHTYNFHSKFVRKPREINRDKWRDMMTKTNKKRKRRRKHNFFFNEVKFNYFLFLDTILYNKIHKENNISGCQQE